MTLQTYSPILELRMYTLRKDRRDEMIDLFDRALIEPREAVGMHILGQFRDLDNPKRWTWLQGFKDMESRKNALAAFYTSPVWKENAKAANATIHESGNVLLLHPAHPTSGFNLKDSGRPPLGSTSPQSGFVTATIYYFEEPVRSEFIQFFEKTVKPIMTGSGASILSYFVTEESPNNYPRLSIREGEHVFVWFAGFPSAESHQKSLARLALTTAWGLIQAELNQRIHGEPETMRLTPTPRSWLTGIP